MPAIPMGYRQIADDLRARIQAGEYPPGSRLPTQSQLAELYSAHVSTIKQSLIMLKLEGVIVGVQGGGLYVAE